LAACAAYDVAKSHELFDWRKGEALSEDFSLSGWGLEQEVNDAEALSGVEQDLTASVKPAVDGVN